MLRVGVTIAAGVNVRVVVSDSPLGRGGLRGHLARLLVAQGGGVKRDHHPPRFGSVEHAEAGCHAGVVVAQVVKCVSCNEREILGSF